MTIFALMFFVVSSFINEAVVIRETFDYPDGELPEGWWSEGCDAQIKGGRLFVDADTTSYRQCTVWFDRELSGNISIEFDVHVVSSSDTSNNINCFFMYSHPDKTKTIKSSRNERKEGKYGDYHKLNGYIITYLANGNEERARFRFRKNPGFNLLQEKFEYECKAGKTYHIKIVKDEDRIEYWVDGKKFIDSVDPKSHNDGLFGFRTWHAKLWWDNLVIKPL